MLKWLGVAALLTAGPAAAVTTVTGQGDGSATFYTDGEPINTFSFTLLDSTFETFTFSMEKFVQYYYRDYFQGPYADADNPNPSGVSTNDASWQIHCSLTGGCLEYRPVPEEAMPGQNYQPLSYAFLPNEFSISFPYPLDGYGCAAPGPDGSECGLKVNGFGATHPAVSVNATFAGSSRFEATFGSVSAAPEPGTWAMLIAGFGALGAALRRRPAANLKALR